MCIRDSPKSDEWAKIEKLRSFLKVFQVVICAFSGSKYPTSNLYFSNVVRVRLVLKEEMENGDGFMKSMATRIFAKFLRNIRLNLVPSWLFLPV